MERRIKLLIVDVDGTLTDAGVYYDNNENEIKKFCTRDAAGFFAAKRVGIKTMILTGRESSATTRRMKEMKVDYLFQNIKDKASFLTTFFEENNYTKCEIGFIGDDLNDIPSMRLVGFVGCPSDSCDEVKSIADYVSSVPGGHGVFRDVVEHLLKMTGEWDIAVSSIYGIGC